MTLDIALDDVDRNFSGAETLIGTVRGLRSFYFWRPPALTGWWGGTWKAGENIAECVPSQDPMHRLPELLDEEHDIPSEACTCGMYAYHSTELPTYQRELAPVLAVIDGYGNVLIGDMGFRAEKARILAIAPNQAAPLQAKVLLRYYGEQVSGYYGVPLLESQRDLLRNFPLRSI